MAVTADDPPGEQTNLTKHMVAMPVTTQMSDLMSSPGATLEWSADLSNWITIGTSPFTGQCPIVFIASFCSNVNQGFTRVRYQQ